MTAHRQPLRELHRQLCAGSLSAETLVRNCLDCIAAHEPSVQAWAWVDPEQALAAAKAADAAPATGPLLGIPIGIKDVIDTADMPTAYGSPIYAGHRPITDAAVVAAVRNAGGIVLGKNVTCEFAGGLPSRTRNPRNPRHSPGGSSSGSAAAVAGMVPVALGTQTAGSIVRPASFCGVVGYKPTYGLINRAGVKPLAESVDTIGVFANRVDDAAWLTAAIAERPELADDKSPLTRPPRFALCRTDKWSVADADGQHALESAAQLLARAGATVIDVELPFACAALMEAGLAVISTDARRAFGHELRSVPELLSPKMRDFLAMADIGNSTRYDSAQIEFERARAALDAEVFTRFDAVLTLSAPGEAPADLTTTGNAAFNFAWTLLHAPCISIPGLTGAHGMPIGMQLIGRRRGDAQLLQVARWAEAVVGRE